MAGSDEDGKQNDCRAIDAKWQQSIANSKAKYDACLHTSDPAPMAGIGEGHLPPLTSNDNPRFAGQPILGTRSYRPDCLDKSREFVPGVGSLSFLDMTKAWNDERKAAGCGATSGRIVSGPPPYIPSKKPEEPPKPVVKLISFGKLFLTFCMPALCRIAEKEGLDEVQVNFYQLNESCGPVSLHSIAEFPVELTDAEQKYADFCVRRGGESISVLDFVEWANAHLFAEKRSPGYGQRHMYEPTAAPGEKKTDDAKKEDKAQSADQQKSKMVDWYDKYGEFKLPVLTLKLDTLYEGDVDVGVDLLYKLTHRVGPQYNPPPQKFDSTKNNTEFKRILRADLYDRTYNPYDRQSRIFKDRDGSYQVFDSSVNADVAESTLQLYKRVYADNSNESQIKEEPVPNANLSRVTIDGVPLTRTIPKGKNVLKDYIGNSIPTLVIGGTNATLISKAQFSSKTDGLNAARQLTGGSYKFKSTLAPNGLSMSENNLPIRALPAEVQITTMGCPLASARQMFFLDFETGTTIDNIYAVRSIQHNFAPGKYDSTWTFTFADGYAKFFGAAGVNKALRIVAEGTKDQKEAAEASGDPQTTIAVSTAEWGQIAVSEKDKPK